MTKPPDPSPDLSPFDITVVIPAYNSEHRLGIPLTALAQQEIPAGVGVEVLVVNNGSHDRTVAVATGHSAVAHLRSRGIPCRVVDEPRQGLTYARIRGIHEARSPWVCFLDDDNQPCSTYLAAGLQAIAEPNVGLLVSRISPQFRVTPPSSIARRSHLLAINEQLGETRICWKPDNILPPTLGAGLWVKRSAFLSAIPWATPERLLPDRLGSTLVSGGDIEIGHLIGQAGYDRLYEPALSLQHIIPPERLQTRYFCRLITGIIRSQLTLQQKYQGNPSLSPRFWRFLRLLGAIVAVPGLLFRQDGCRETLFVLVARWAELLGSYPHTAAVFPNSSEMLPSSPALHPESEGD